MIKASLDFFEPHQRLENLNHFKMADVQRILVIGIDQFSGLMSMMLFFESSEGYSCKLI